MKQFDESSFGRQNIDTMKRIINWKMLIAIAVVICSFAAGFASGCVYEHAHLIHVIETEGMF
jgi:hypothetical protein